MTAIRLAAGRLLCVTAAVVAMAGAGAGSAQAGEPAVPAGFQEATFVGLAEDPVEEVAISEAEADARAQAADAGFVDCWVVDVEVLLPPGQPFPIETVFGARVTISCAD